MSDEVKEFAAWKYDTGSHIKAWLILAAIAGTIITFVLASNVTTWFFVLLAVPIALVIHIVRADYDHALLVANRYLILGDVIMYYRNVSHARLDRGKETLTITTDKGRGLVIEAARFPTNARKPDKIKHNKSAKFNKVADKIIKRLKETVPDSVVD